MREIIKFRAWEKKGKAYINGFNMVGFSTGQGAPKMKLQRYNIEWAMEDVVLEQFTGLLDKSGVEIYEGEIVRIANPDTITQVVWDDDVACFAFTSRWSHTYRYELSDSEELEVIGSIHTTPDLLK